MGRRSYTVTNELNKAATEEATFDHVAETRDNKPGSTDPDDQKDTRLNEDEGKIIGPSILLPVAAGDKIEIRTAAYYNLGEGTDYNSHTTAEQLVSGLLSSLSGNGAYQTINEGGVSGEITGASLSSCDFLYAMQEVKAHNIAEAGKPQAFLNYLMLDEHMKIVNDQSGFIQTKDADTWNELNVPEMEAKQSGYIVVFLSNESKMSVHFDNLVLVHYKGKLLEENHYYPYGLTLTNKAFSLAPDNDNLLSGNKLNRKEFAGGSGLNWYDMDARMYDPQIGRWHSADPLMEQAANWTPYRYAFDNPVVFTDANGLAEGPWDCWEDRGDRDDFFDRVGDAIESAADAVGDALGDAAAAVGNYLADTPTPDPEREEEAEDPNESVTDLSAEAPNDYDPDPNPGPNPGGGRNGSTQARVLFFKDEAKAYQYMLNNSTQNLDKTNLPRPIENSGFVVKDGVFVFPTQGQNLNGENYRNYAADAEWRVLNYKVGSNGISLQYNGQWFLALAQVHTHPEIPGGGGTAFHSGADVGVMNSIKTMSIVIAPHQTYGMVPGSNSPVIVTSTPDLVNGKFSIIKYYKALYKFIKSHP